MLTRSRSSEAPIGRLVGSPTAHERTVAAGMHLATTVAPLIAPIVVMNLWRGSPFVSGQAKKSLRETLILQGVLFCLALCSLAYTLWSLKVQHDAGWHNFSIWPIIAKAVLIWLALAVLEFVNGVIAVRQAIKAFSGT